MAQQDTSIFDEIPRKSLTMRGEALRKSLAERGESGRKGVADDVFKRQIGAAIERAIDLAGLDKKDVAFQMGYPDQSALSRWISGVETPQLSKLWIVVALRSALVIALAELANDTVAVQTTITIRRVG